MFALCDQRFGLVGTICRGAVAVLMIAAVARADVFNMPAGQTSLSFVNVGDPGNAGDTVTMNSTYAAINDGTSGYGVVSYSFAMGTFDVTTAQYCQFLNAVAKSDPYSLFNSGMTNGGGVTVSGYPVACGIIKSGTSGNYSYRVATTADISTGSYHFPAFCANLPVNWDSWGDAARFCNWLENGQPTGAEGSGTTETGTYTLNGAMTTATLFPITRNAGAKYWIPSENEWYKSAYYAGGSTATTSNGTPDSAGYWYYPTQADSSHAPSSTLSTTGTNNANWNASGLAAPNNWVLTPVGYYAGSPSHFGTYDQGGDLYSFTDTAVTVSTAIANNLQESDNNQAPWATTLFVMRGGSFHLNTTQELMANCRYGAAPGKFGHGRTFRIAMQFTSAQWSGEAVSNNWSSVTNWNGDAPPVAGVSLQFGPSDDGTANNDDFAPGTQFKGITFTSGAPSYNLSGNTIALAGPVTNPSGSDQAISLAVQLVAGGGTIDTGTNNVTVSGAISGGVPLIKNGTGALILSGSNSYTGGTSINAGTLQIGNSGSITGYVLDNGTLVCSHSDAYTFGLAISGNGSFIQTGSGAAILKDSNTYTGGTTISAGTLQLGSGGSSGGASGSISGAVCDNGTLAFNRSNLYTFGGAISGNGTVIQAGGGKLVLTGTNTYSGGTTIANGTLAVSSTANLGTGPITIGPATFENTADMTLDATRTVTLASASSTFSADPGTTLTVNGLVQGSGGLTQAGGGALVLTGTNTYSGDTAINAGTLQLNNAYAAGNSTVSVGVDNGLAFGPGVANPLLGGLSGGGDVNLATTDAPPLAVFLTAGGNNADTIYSGTLSGSGGLTKAGSGTLVLTGTNTYSGGTTINAGALAIATSAGIGTGTLAINAGTLQTTGDL
ncbi:MAG: autotransporter-associated beta strand repeat-containing protein, partial [Thermoguttaceae bacterium]